ncbi:dihydropteroate synthase [Soonwooa sp.]|uniref:dihydropteroate synthase n=1 Tax=Soonwooa sp. TaxID=1938592 RepID=UPI00260C7F56|nr:dihydropteroate synthase [Soonwooa sp.]
MKFSNSAFSADKQFSINCNGRLIDLSQPKIMGILNLTPDSFSDGGKFNSEKNALLQAEQLLKDNASIIDIGAQSTRPNAEHISAKEEINRIGNTISLIKKEFPEALISLDTFYGEVVKFGYNEGIDIVNDISAGQFDDQMLNEVAKTGLPYILMHINSDYDKMHHKEHSDDIIIELNKFFSKKVNELNQLGIKDIILDPGFGFSKTQDNQLQIINELEYIGFGEFPILIGISRKSFIYKPLGKSPLEIQEEVAKIHQQLFEKGAKIFRVHEPALLKF